MEHPFGRQGRLKRDLNTMPAVPSEGVLLGVAQLAVALAGFAGVVAVFRSEGDWTELQAFRLSVLVRNSLGVMFMALLPLVFFAVYGSAPTAIGIASGSSAVWMLLTVVQLQRQWLRFGAFRTWPNLTSTTLAVLATALFVVNAVWLDTAWPYVAALCLVLLTAALAFQRMVGVRR
jgi:hypothetical protein